MSIRINEEKCVGCGRCMDACPGNLIVKKEGRAFMKYPRDCWGCVSCVKECPAGAIDFFLGADIGGRGSTMCVEHDGDVLRWIIHKYDGTLKTIDVNRKDANRY